MRDVTIENPVINSPFDEPQRHFRFTDEGITDEIVAARRTSQYFVPIARPKTKGAQKSLETEWTEDRIEERGQLDELGGRRDRVAEADIDLDRTPGTSQEGDARDPHSHVLRGVADGLGRYGVGCEHKPIEFNRRAADVPEGLDEAVR